MRRINIVLFVMLIFSIVIEMSMSIINVQAETKAVQLVNDEFLDLSYSFEKGTDLNYWTLDFERKSVEKDRPQRLKIKVIDEDDNVIDYPVKADMIEQDGWLIEKEFSAQKKGQILLELSQSIKQLKLYIQMDQQEGSSKASEIKENILVRKEPFILEKNQQTDEKAAQKTSRSALTTKTATISSEDFVGPRKEVQKKSSLITKADANVTSQMHTPLYENKETSYKHDAGTYPEFSWQPDGQSNVINHQGGTAGQDGWDGLGHWDVGNDEHLNSYIKYGDDSNTNIQLRKYAQQTDDPTEFKIKLNVRGNTTYKPGVDIVFLIDNSDSMYYENRKVNAEKALETIIEALKGVNVPSVENIRIGAHIFSEYSQYQSWGGKPGETRTFGLSKNTADWDDIVKEYKRAEAKGVTFTQRGLVEAKDIFDDAPDSQGRHKLLFVLTDGAPNRSWKTNDKGTPNPDMYLDKLHFKDFISGSKGNYNLGDTLDTTGNKTTISPPYGGVINSHITTTNSTAMDLKNSGIEIHTIALKLTVNVNEWNIRDQLIRGLYKMSTKKANAVNGPDNDVASDFHFYDVENGDNLTEYFKSWYETIIRTVDKGTITDPLGDMFELVGTPTWRQVDNTGKRIESEPNIALSNNNRQIDVSNINLTGLQEIEVEYTVRLRIDDPTFVSNRWYPTNGETILHPTPERTNDSLEFGRPSAKYQKADFVIPVEKVWLDKYKEEHNYWKLRSEKIIAKLQKLNGVKWEDIETIELDEDHDWKGSFSPVEGGPDNTYRVIESERTNGYKKPIISQESFTSETLANGGIKITNELLQGDYYFWKFMEDGKTQFGTDLPKFKVTRGEKLVAENVTPDPTSGKVELKNLPIGDYTVEETYVPKGFEQLPNFTINVTENNSSAPTALVFQVNGSTEHFIAKNVLKDFSLIVEKVDENDSKLTGATFKLTGPNYDKTISGNAVFDFTGLRPGSYTLTETENPDGYERLKTPISIEIGIDGKIAVSEHPNASGSGAVGETGNTIQLKVTNKKVRPGALPRTGSFGFRGKFLSVGLLVMGVFLSIVYLYINRKKS